MTFFDTLRLFLRFKLIAIKQNILFNLLPKDDIILIEGYPEGDNFGDALNVPLVEFLSGKKVLYSKFINEEKIEKFAKYAVIGSVIQSVKNNTIIWGAGFIKEDIEKHPKNPSIQAVRGPKTRKLFLERGINCPEIYGDPALLLPYIYKPFVEKKYKYGLIPHIVDKDSSWILKNSQRKDVLLIDLEVGQDYNKVVDELLSCEFIFTSSLHGLIIAYAYGIPYRHIRISDKIIGGNFKFDDFHLSVNKTVRDPYHINENSELLDIELEADSEPGSIDLDALINSCPFIMEESRSVLYKAKKNDKQI